MRMIRVVRLLLTCSPLLPGTTGAHVDFVRLHGAICVTSRSGSAVHPARSVDNRHRSSGATGPHVKQARLACDWGEANRRARVWLTSLGYDLSRRSQQPQYRNQPRTSSRYPPLRLLVTVMIPAPYSRL